MSGPGAFEIAAQCLDPWPLETRRATLVRVHAPQDRQEIDRALATAFESPHSFTGERVVEISTHGGALAPAATLAALVRAGAREAEAGEFTRRALMHGKIDLVQAEAIGDLIDAPSARYYRAALGQLSGALTRAVNGIRESLLELEALLAYDVDFPEEDDGPIPRERVGEAAFVARAAIERLLATLPAARISREGAVVVLAGLPNTGKSSLFNALVGEARAIVTEFAGTTRDAIDALVEGDSYPLRLIDTAGLRDATDPVERIGVEVSSHWLARADVVLACGRNPGELEATCRAVASHGALVIRVRTMADLGQAGASADVHVSAHTGEGLPQLRAAISSALDSRYHIAPETPMILRARHEHALRHAAAEITDFVNAWRDGSLPATVAAVHVRAAIASLDTLIGGIDVDDVLARVFERFCVGK
jgi:tRNA modification GTPase